MKKCFFLTLVFSSIFLSSCSSDNSAYSNGYDEGYNSGYDEGYKAAEDEILGNVVSINDIYPADTIWYMQGQSDMITYIIDSYDLPTSVTDELWEMVNDIESDIDRMYPESF
mgnify:FL=1